MTRGRALPQQLDALALVVPNDAVYIELDLAALLQHVRWPKAANTAAVFLAASAQGAPLRAALRTTVRIRDGKVGTAVWRVQHRDLAAAFTGGTGRAVCVVAVDGHAVAVAPVTVGLTM